MTDGFDYTAYDKERIEKLGYPADWLRRCGIHPKNMHIVTDEIITQVCENIKSFDSMVAMTPIVFGSLDIPENVFFDSSVLSYENVPERKTRSAETDETPEKKPTKKGFFGKIADLFGKSE